MWLEAQVNLYNMWTPIGKSDVKMFFQLISCLFTYWHKCKQRVKIFFSPSSKKNSKNNFWKQFYPQKLIFSGFGAKNIHLKNPNDFLFTFWPISKQTADVQKNVEGLE